MNVIADNAKQLYAPPFTRDHDQFRDVIRKFLKKEVMPHADEWEEKGEFPMEMFKKMANLGLFGTRLDSFYGGSELDYWYTVAYIEEMSTSGLAGFSMDMYVHGELVLPILNEMASEEQKEEFLRPGIKGDLIGCLGITEPGGGSDVAAIKTTAIKEGDEYVINGSKTFITNGGRADFILLAVKTSPEKSFKGISFILFKTDTKGFTVGKTLKKLGNHSSNTAELYFDDCRVPARYLLGKENSGFSYIMKNFLPERLMMAVASTASAEHMWHIGVNYGKKRKAFKKPIIKNQIWRHELAQMRTEIECAKLLTYQACDLYNRGQSCTTEITMAKLYTSELVNKVIDRVLQMHGGFGYMEEYPIARAWRDSRLIPIGGGTSEIMREILAAYWKL